MRLLVIGLDSACFPILEVTNSLGLTPCLAGLMEEGFSARLRSTLPAITPPAWTSAMTGVRPERHGVVSFCRPDRETGLVRPTSGRERLARTLINYLAEDGIPSAAVNIPWTYPADPSATFFISGFDAPRLTPDACYPPEALDVLLDAAPDYVIHPVQSGDVDQATQAVDSRVDAVLALCRWRPVEVLFTVFMSTDSVAHVHWPENLEAMEPTHPLARTYQSADAAVARLIEELSPDSVVILSDHGMGKCDALVNISRPLFDAGLMQPAGGLRRRMIAPLYRAARSVYRHARSRRTRVGADSPAVASHPNRFAPRVDWMASAAHSGHGFGLVAVPTGRAGLVEEAREAIAEAAGRHSSNPIRSVQSAGSAPGNPQSALFVCEVDFGAGYWLCPPILDPSEPFVIRDENHPAFQQAGHRRHGLFIAAGPEAMRGTRGEDIAIEDVCPTLLHLAGAPVPAGLDGHLVVQAFSSEALMRRPPSVRHVTLERDEAVGEARPEDDAVVSQRLRDLGYL